MPTECVLCSELVESRSCIVNGVGSSDADLMFIGEGPGQREDEEGEPFVGPSGERLDTALESVGIERAECFITNTVRCRPSNNRDPTDEEKRNCFPYLQAEIDEVDPELIVGLGGHSLTQLLPHDYSPIGDAGNVLVPDSRYPPRMPCPHPAATFYNNDWDDIFTGVIEEAAEYVRS